MTVENKPNTTPDEVENKPYITPELTVHGDVEAITQANTGGGRLDADFPAGTPRGEITFS